MPSVVPWIRRPTSRGWGRHVGWWWCASSLAPHPYHLQRNYDCTVTQSHIDYHSQKPSSMCILLACIHSVCPHPPTPAPAPPYPYPIIIAGSGSTSGSAADRWGTWYWSSEGPRRSHGTSTGDDTVARWSAVPPTGK